MRRLALLIFIIVLAVPAIADTKGKVKLVHKQRKGDRLSVKERSRTETTIHWKGEGQGSANVQEIEEVQREYVEEVLKESPVYTKRDYKLSTRLKGRAKDDKLEPVRTSVHGKLVFMGPEGPKIEGGELSKDDRESLNTLEKIAYALLPPNEVGPGDTWKVSDEIGRALFGPMFDPENFKTQGTAKLDSWKTVDARKAAKLALRVAIEVRPSEILPRIELELKGTALFLIEEGVFVELVLEGPVHYSVEKMNEGRKVNASSEGTMAYKLKADVIAGAPAKPVVKDDELARAKKVACPTGHAFPNEFAFCGSCGKAISKETRRCLGGCPPLLRFCPLCGEGLNPKDD